MISLFTLVAFFWLHLILSVISPNIIELWEAAVTTLLFPILILFAYAIDAGWILGKKQDERQHQVDLNSLESGKKLKIMICSSLTDQYNCFGSPYKILSGIAIFRFYPHVLMSSVIFTSDICNGWDLSD